MASSSKSPMGKRNPPVSLNIARRRPRALTEEFTGPKTSIDPDDPLPKPPKAEQSVEGYTIERVTKGLRYADQVMRHPTRNLSPLGLAGMKLYKDSCRKLLELQTRGDEFFKDDTPKLKNDLKLQYVSTLRTFEHNIANLGIFQLLGKEKDKVNEMQKELVKLRRMGFYARYGDYLAPACKRLRKEAEARKVEHWDTLTGSYWTDIALKIEKEKTAWTKRLDGIDTPELEIATHLAVRSASLYTGFDPDENLAIIHQYAQRNKLLHAPLHEHIGSGDFPKLAEILATDLNTIGAAIPPEEQTSQNLLVGLINAMIDQWFERWEDDPENNKLWTAKPALFALLREMKAGKSKEVKEKIVKETHTAWAKGIEKRNEAIMAKNELERIQDFPPAGSTKRVASAEMEEASRENKKRNGQWAGVVKNCKSLRASSESYIATWGEFAPPPELIKGP